MRTLTNLLTVAGVVLLSACGDAPMEARTGPGRPAMDHGGSVTLTTDPSDYAYPGQSVTLTATVTSGTPAKYRWIREYDGYGHLLGETTTNTFVDSNFPDASHTEYTVQVKTASGFLLGSDYHVVYRY